MICVELGGHPCDEHCGYSEETCKRWGLLIIERFGEPPAGAYFWTKHFSWILVLCYDRNNSQHAEYAEAVVHGAPRIWSKEN